MKRSFLFIIWGGHYHLFKSFCLIGGKVAAKITTSCISDMAAFLWFVIAEQYIGQHPVSCSPVGEHILHKRKRVEEMTIVLRLKGGEQCT